VLRPPDVPRSRLRPRAAPRQVLKAGTGGKIVAFLATLPKARRPAPACPG